MSKRSPLPNSKDHKIQREWNHYTPLHSSSATTARIWKCHLEPQIQRGPEGYRKGATQSHKACKKCQPLGVWRQAKGTEIAITTAQASSRRYDPGVQNSHWHRQNNITRVSSWGPDRRKWLFSEVRGGIWTPHSPVLIKISADKRPLNQLTVKKIFFSLIIKTFCY